MRNHTPRRTHRICVRLTSEEFAQLDAQAKAVAVELSAFVRKLILNTPIPVRAKHRSPDIVVLGRVLTALNRIGGNINELTKKAHMTGDTAAYRYAQEDRAQLAVAARAVMIALEMPEQ